MDQPVSKDTPSIAFRSLVCAVAFVFAVTTPLLLPFLPRTAPRIYPSGASTHSEVDALLASDRTFPNVKILPLDSAAAASEIGHGDWAVWFVPQWDPNAYVLAKTRLSAFAEGVADDARVGVFSYADTTDIGELLPEEMRSRVYVGGFLAIYRDGHAIGICEDSYFPEPVWVRERFSLKQGSDER